MDLGIILVCGIVVGYFLYVLEEVIKWYKNIFDLEFCKLKIHSYIQGIN